MLPSSDHVRDIPEFPPARTFSEFDRLSDALRKFEHKLRDEGLNTKFQMSIPDADFEIAWRRDANKGWRLVVIRTTSTEPVLVSDSAIKDKMLIAVHAPRFYDELKKSIGHVAERARMAADSLEKWLS